MPTDPGPVERFLWGFWVLNSALFVCLVPFTLLLGQAGWPLRAASAVGLLGACAWEAAALRARRFPFWADVLETLTVALLAWRFPGQTGPPLILFVVTFALAGLGFRILYGSPWQAAARTVTTLAAIFVGRLLSLPVPDPGVALDRMLPVLVPTAFIAIMCGLLIRAPAVAARARRVADRLNADLVAATIRTDVNAAVLKAVMDLLPTRPDIRVILWDVGDNLQPTMAAGNRAAEVPSTAGQLTSLPSWMLDPLLAGESVYREAVEYSYRQELREAIGFDPIGGATFAVPLHPEAAEVLTIGASHPIPALERREIENLAKVVAMTRGSMELTEQLRTSQDALHQRSNYDPLTRLPNRELLGERVERAFAGGDRRIALLLLDLDHFNTINDSLGPLAGDDALVAIARRIASCVRPRDTVARLGSDEFAVLLDRFDDPGEPVETARRIIEVLNAPLIGLQGIATDVYVRASVGIALSGPAARTPRDLLANADIAMHAAKVDGSAVWRVFEPAMRATVLDRLELESDLNRALERGELVVHYQPIVDLQRGRIVGVEALARWRHPERGLIPSGSFIAVAEESGLIDQIGAWVLREGCRQLREWSDAGPELDRLFLNVNVSPRQLARPKLADRFGEIIADVGIDPSRVTLELTENVLVEDTEANLRKLQALKALGLRLAVDDFGTGFSSLSYLQRFPFDVIKIDRAFVLGVDADPEEGTGALARAIISMARALGLACVAEGVETARQRDWLRDAGCDAAQGYLFAPAMTPDRLLPLLTSDPAWLAARH